MQRKNIETLKANLLSNLDDDCNVINVEGALAAVNELLEHPTTQEELEQTRLGKYVNEFRKKTSHVELSKKAKELLRKYQLIVSQAAGTDNFRKKEASQVKNGNHTHGSVPASHPNTSKVLDHKSHLNGKIKTPSQYNASDRSKEKLCQAELKNIPSCSSNNSQQNNISVVRNGTPPVSIDNSFKKNVNTQDSSSKRAFAALSISKDSSVINGSNSPSILNHRKAACDMASTSGRKRHLDVPSVNSDYTKKAKFDNSQFSESSSAGKAKFLNGTVPSATSESKVFSCKVSPDLKCTIRSEHIKPSAISSPALSIKNSSSKQDLTKPDVVNKPRKVETTEQLLHKLRLNGDLCSMPSQTIYKFKNNQTTREQIEETTIVPDEVKRKSNKKKSKPQPPAATGDMSEIKNELVQKFLRTSVNSTNSTIFLEPPEIEDIRVECPKTATIDISNLDPDSEEYKKELLKNPWAFLPPLSNEEIICDHEKESFTIPGCSTDEVDKYLSRDWCGVNGQYDFKSEWRPFDRSYSITNSNNSYLHILPYVTLN